MTISILFGGTGAMFCSEIISVAKFYRKINYLKYSDPTVGHVGKHWKLLTVFSCTNINDIVGCLFGVKEMLALGKR